MVVSEIGPADAEHVELALDVAEDEIGSGHGAKAHQTRGKLSIGFAR
jgi:hypothetical protein